MIHPVAQRLIDYCGAVGTQSLPFEPQQSLQSTTLMPCSTASKVVPMTSVMALLVIRLLSRDMAIAFIALLSLSN